MATTTNNYLGKCKECDYVIFATREDVQPAETFRDVLKGAGVFRVGNNGFFARCQSGHKVFPVKAIKGTYSEAHQCDSRCLNAKGWSCTCSCGGANHGRGHVATVVKASELPKQTERKHLGEVGKHIRGQVTLTRVRKNGNMAPTKALFVFHTKDGDEITWWVPSEYAPEWEEGWTGTIRAKVIRHEDHERFGKSTVVIYVEEVE